MLLPSVLFTICAYFASASPVAASHDQLLFAPPSAGSSSLPSIDSLDISPTHLAHLQHHIASLPEKRLIKLAEDAAAIEVTEGEKALLVFQGTRFVDVTDAFDIVGITEKETYPHKVSTLGNARGFWPEVSADKRVGQIAYTAKALKPLIKSIDLEYMETFLRNFTSFRTRYYRSETGRQSQQFLLAELKSIASMNKKANVTFREFQHPWRQKTIIARFEPSVNATSPKVVILSSHLDSINQLVFLPAPGADDDGSGVSSNLMAFKALVANDFVPSTQAVEFHFYSAEEGGMLGSQAVAQSYRSDGKTVRGMLHLDQTAWVKKGSTPVIALINDNVDAGLTDFIRKLIGEYSALDYVDTKFSKLLIAFAVELGGGASLGL
ncbi:bacterial leucyl aminopeptidase, partial [Phenoliferia sp. Uapishka_3]